MAVDGESGRAAIGRRVTRRRTRTRANLLRAAFCVFAAKGFGHVSIEEVCEAAGCTRGAFYANFDGLDELFFALYAERAEFIAEQVSSALALDGPDLDVPVAVDRVTEVLPLDRDWLLGKTDFLVHAAHDPVVSRSLLEHRAAAPSRRGPAGAGPRPHRTARSPRHRRGRRALRGRRL